jgi:hypothetical protein
MNTTETALTKYADRKERRDLNRLHTLTVNETIDYSPDIHPLVHQVCAFHLTLRPPSFLYVVRVHAPSANDLFWCLHPSNAAC